MRRPVVFANPENRCFGCGPTNAHGLKLAFFETDTGVETEYCAPAFQEGAHGILHGGVQATLLDETMCMTAYAKLGVGVVTGELTIRYLQPAPTETALVATAHILELKGNSVFIEGRIRVAGEDNELTRARGRFFSNTGKPFTP